MPVSLRQDMLGKVVARGRAPFWRLFLVLGLCGFLGAVLSCDGPGQVADSSRADKQGSGETEEDSVPVKVVLPSRGDIAVSIRTTTSIRADKEADVYSKMVGYCQRIFVEEGDSVQSGDPLAKLEDKELQLTFDQVGARLDKVEVDYVRSEKLFSEGLISKQMYQDISLQRNLAKADYELAKKRLQDTSVVAPFSGIVTKRNSKPGDLVTTTQPLFKIVDLNILVAEVHIPEQDYLKVRQGQEAILAVDAFPGEPFVGLVERVNPVIDSQSGTAQATVTIKNPRGILRPGMFVRLQIITDVHRNALMIPKEAVIIQGKSRVVYVVREGVAHETSIQAGFEEAGRTEVLSGLDEQDRVIVMGHLGLRSETRVRVIEEPRG